MRLTRPKRPSAYCVVALCLPWCGIGGEDGPVISTVPSLDALPAHLKGESKGQAKDPMTQLLHWGLEHSDPEQLKELMLKYKEGNLTLKDVYGQELLDQMFRNEGEEMIGYVANIMNYQNESLPEEDLQTELERLQELVEQVDNAGNLHRMGGLEPLLNLAVGNKRSAETRTLALWTLGVAVQNNEPVQADLVSLGGVEKLGLRLGSCGRPAQLKPGDWNTDDEDAQYCGKLLYALSGLLKNSETAQKAASALGVFDWLFLAGMHHKSMAVVKKSISLAETVLAQTPDLPILAGVDSQQERFASALLRLVRGTDASDSDTDKAEKALHLINRILAVRPTLFGQGFRSELVAAVAEAGRRCDEFLGKGEEPCQEIRSLGTQAEGVLAAIDVADEEL